MCSTCSNIWVPMIFVIPIRFCFFWYIYEHDQWLKPKILLALMSSRYYREISWYTLTNYWERVCVRGRYKLYHSYLNGLRRQDFKLKRTFTENCTNYGKLSHHNVRAPHELWDKHFVSEFSSTAHLLIPWSTWSLNKITTIIIKCRYLLSLNPWKTGLKPVLISPSHFPPTVTCRVCFFLWPVPV